MDIEAMTDDQREKVQNALYYADHAIDMIGRYSFKPSPESDSADRILRDTLRAAGRRIPLHQSSKDAMRAWEMVQKSIEQLEPLDAWEIIDRLKLAQDELHKLFSDVELEAFLKYRKEHENDCAWVRYY